MQAEYRSGKERRLANLRPGQGRKKGVPNKFTTLKQSFLNVYLAMGGDDELLAWAKTHKNQFYLMLTRLFPQEHEHSGEVKTGDRLVVEVVHLRGAEILGDEGGNGRKAK